MAKQHYASAIWAEYNLVPLLFILFTVFGLANISVTVASIYSFLISTTFLIYIIRSGKRPIVLTAQYSGTSRTLLKLLANIIMFVFLAFVFGHLFRVFPYQRSEVLMFVVSVTVMSASLTRTILNAASLRYQAHIIRNTSNK